MAEIELSQNQVTVIDDNDAESLLRFKWCATWRAYTFYAMRGIAPASSPDGKYKTILMHRAIMGLEHGDPRVVDHINGNGLDNRRCNMRVCAKQQNYWNWKNRKPSASGYVGVELKASGRWLAKIIVNRRTVTIGTFGDPIEAARAYDAKARELRGEFAVLDGV